MAAPCRIVPPLFTRSRWAQKPAMQGGPSMEDKRPTPLTPETRAS